MSTANDEDTGCEKVERPSQQQSMEKVSKSMAALSMNRRLIVSPCDAKLHLDSPSKILKGRSKEKLRQEPIDLSECLFLNDQSDSEKQSDGGVATETTTKCQDDVIGVPDVVYVSKQGKKPTKAALLMEKRKSLDARKPARIIWKLRNSSNC